MLSLKDHSIKGMIDSSEIQIEADKYFDYTKELYIDTSIAEQYYENRNCFNSKSNWCR